MRASFRGISLIGAILVAMSVSILAGIWIAQPNRALGGPAISCSLATIAGAWGFRSSGKTPDGFDVHSVGTFIVTVDGRSSFRGWSFANRPGATLVETSGTGTTTVTPECTGVQVWEAIPDDPAKIVIARNGTEMWAIYTKRLSFVTLEKIASPRGP